MSDAQTDGVCERSWEREQRIKGYSNCRSSLSKHLGSLISLGKTVTLKRTAWRSKSLKFEMKDKTPQLTLQKNCQDVAVLLTKIKYSPGSAYFGTDCTVDELEVAGDLLTKADQEAKDWVFSCE